MTSVAICLEGIGIIHSGNNSNRSNGWKGNRSLSLSREWRGSNRSLSREWRDSNRSLSREWKGSNPRLANLIGEEITGAPVNNAVAVTTEEKEEDKYGFLNW